MASSPPLKRRTGRPKLPGSLKVIRLRESVFQLWRTRKEALGFLENTDSEFAEYILHQRTQSGVGAANDISSASVDNNKSSVANPLFMSTPISMPVQRSKSNIDHHRQSRCQLFESGVQGESQWQTRCKLFDRSINSELITGNPCSVADNVGSVPEEDGLDVSKEGVFFDDNYFPDLENSVESILEELNGSDIESDVEDLSEESYLALYECDEENLGITNYGDQSMDISSDEDERTLTMIDPDYGIEEDPSQSNEVPVNVSQDEEFPDEIDNCIEKNENQVVDKLKEAYRKLMCVDNLETFVDLHERKRVLVSTEKLIELIQDKCSICGSSFLHVMKDSIQSIGSRVEITRKCAQGHQKKWISSEVLGKKNNIEYFLNDSLQAAAIIISGNNYSKFALLCKALDLNIISNSAFTRFQKHCAVPVVERMWKSMNELTISILKEYDDLCLCGDGRNDSPGHSARYCVYTLMEHATKVIVDMEVLDKRETGGNSVNMEREGLRRLLERLKDGLKISELTTDSSSTIMKLVREMKAKYPPLVQLFHSLDVWHKAKKLSKCLHKAAKVKGCEPLQVWIDDIVTHFWFSCQNCKGNADELKQIWFGVVHHVCGEHKWAEGACSHSDELESTSKPYLPKSSKAAAALRLVVLDPKWLNKLEFYVKFRHTSVLESYNNMLTKYAPKRIAFEYPYFIMRVMLAAIDHNMHLSRERKLSKDGNERGHRKYSKRSKKFHAEILKVEKSYSYFPCVIAKMLKERCELLGSFTQPTDDNIFNPKQIAATIGMKEPPSTRELLKGPSRLSKPETSPVTTTATQKP